LFNYIYIYYGDKYFIENKIYKCEHCGCDDVKLFYKGNKNICKSCLSDLNKIKYVDADKQSIFAKQKTWREKNIIHYRVTSAKNRAKNFGYVFELTDDIILKQIEKQNNLCYFSKQTLSFEENNWYSLSIDRLNSDIGYTVDNSVVVTKFVNRAKSNLSIIEFTKLIKEVSENL